MRLGESLAQLVQRLAATTDSPQSDAQVLACEVLGRTRAWLLAHPEYELSRQQQQRFDELAARLAAGEPLPYLLGRWEFYGLELIVTPAVLIPRPETELLVEQALAWLAQRSPAQKTLAADVGAGSGCIAVSLAVHCPALQILASDISPAALQVARANVHRHQVTQQVVCVQADLLPAFRSPFDLICANLPYIPEGALPSLQPARWEPRLALAGGQDGLELYRRLLSQLPAALAPGGLLLLEVEETLGKAVLELALQALPQARLELLQDLAGKDRLVRGLAPPGI